MTTLSDTAGNQEFGVLPDPVCDRVTAWVADAAATVGGAVTALRVRVTRPSASVGAVAQLNLTLDGQNLRTQATAPEPEEAGRRLIERYARQSTLLHRGLPPRPWPDATGAVTRDEPGYCGRSGIARSKAVVLERLDPVAAVQRLDALDHTAYLFSDSATGLDAVVYRGGPYGYRLARTAAAPPPRTKLRLVTNPAAARLLALPEARSRLSGTGDRFLFFTDAATGRGALLYSRYAGTYGLVRTAG